MADTKMTDPSTGSGYDIWHDRRVNIGYETAEELAKKLNPANFRGHPESQADALDDSLDLLGWVGSVKLNINTNRIFDGELRIKRTLVKDPKLQIPVDYYDLSPDEELLALQVHDAITEQAEPIADKLADLLERTREMTADRPGLGAMLQALKERAGINGNGSAPPEAPPMVDRAEELQAKWQVSPGDLFEFPSLATPGRFHRLLCGDCREPDDMMRLTDGQQVNGCFTSPPYAEQRKQQYGGVPVGEYVEWWGAVQTNVRSVLAGDGSFFVNIKEHCEDGQRVLYCKKLVIAMVEAWGWRFVDELCWVRDTAPGKYPNRFKNGFEPVYHFSFDGAIKFLPWGVSLKSDEAILSSSGGGLMSYYDKSGNNKKAVVIGEGLALPSNTFRFNVGEVNVGTKSHDATFPVALPTFFIRAYSDPGDIWLDPFAGSGTVGVAAENEGRIGFMVERLPKYCSVICERLETMGQTPRRVSG